MEGSSIGDNLCFRSGKSGRGNGDIGQCMISHGVAAISSKKEVLEAIAFEYQIYFQEFFGVFALLDVIWISNLTSFLKGCSHTTII